MAANSFATIEKLYKEQKYSETLESLKLIIRERKKKGKGNLRYTKEEALFLWNSAQEQFNLKHYEEGAGFSDALFQDTGYIKSNPDQLVQAGLYIAYNGVEPDYTKGFDYFRKAADCVPCPASYAAMKHLGFMYENGHGVEVDLDKSTQHYKDSAAGGDPAGCYCAGLYHYKLFQKNGSDDFINLAEAAILFEKAAQSGTLDYIKLDSPLLRGCWEQLQKIHIALEKRHAEWAQFYSDKLAYNHQQLENTSDPLESKVEVSIAESSKTEAKQAEEKKDTANASTLSASGSHKNNQVTSAQTLVQGGVFKQPPPSKGNPPAVSDERAPAIGRGKRQGKGRLMTS
ncbi:MAG: hypothetical protein K2Q33_01840 [Gammaproteobacteria bacterium]|nr:hypothetical protein [Gammaproteobacteria bacterium]